MPGGRPSLYDPAYCERVVEFLADGYSLTAFAGEIGVCRDTISEWCKVHPEFSAAVKVALAKASRWWEDRNRSIASGGDGNAVSTIFGLKNRAPADWRDKQEVEHSGGADWIALLAARRDRVEPQA